MIKESDGNRKKLTSLVVIDLVSSIEVFSERLVKQYIKKYNDKNLTTCQIDRVLRLEQSKKILTDLHEITKHEHKNEKSITKLIEIQKLWSDGNFYKLNFNPKLPQGRHGEVMVDNLFKQIGIFDIYDSIEIASHDQSILDSVTHVDVQDLIRDITSKRNVAIHEGAPLHNSISIESLERTYIYVKEIMNAMESRVNQEIDKINNKSIAV